MKVICETVYLKKVAPAVVGYLWGGKMMKDTHIGPCLTLTAYFLMLK
jgi:hypothetical protein